MSKLKIVVDGITVTAAATSARVAIPLNSAGETAAYIRLICPVHAAYGYIRVGNSTVVATTNSLAVTSEEELVLDVTGCTHIATIEGSTAALINIIPVEL
jgi:hypothetical protein